MLHYAFPGNIRELQNLIERGVISAEDGAAIDVAHLFRREQLSDEALLAIGAQGTLDRATTAPMRRRCWTCCSANWVRATRLPLAELERRLLHEAVAAAGGNIAAAARRLGLTRAQFAYRLQRADAPARRRSRRR